MKTIPVQDSRMYSLMELYDMQTNFFHSVLDGISDDDAHSRLDTKANHIAWLAGSLVQQRFELANDINGEKLEQRANELFKDNQGIKEGEKYPSLAQYREDWDRITPILREALLNADAGKLDTKIEMPGMEMILFELVYFIIYREANHIGQMALWRRLLGYEPMKYM